MSKFEPNWWITNSCHIDLKETLPLPYILCPTFYCCLVTNTSCFQTKIQIFSFSNIENTFITKPTDKNRLQRHLQFKIMFYSIKPYILQVCQRFPHCPFHVHRNSQFTDTCPTFSDTFPNLVTRVIINKLPHKIWLGNVSLNRDRCHIIETCYAHGRDTVYYFPWASHTLSILLHLFQFYDTCSNSVFVG